jgi:hypothetical protein
MSDILADYREWSDAQPRAIKTHSDRCHLWHRDCMIHRLADALERARLTDAEREAIVTALAFLREEADEPGVAQDADTLRGLLERLK